MELSRKTLWSYRKGKAIPRLFIFKKIKDSKLKEELALIAIKKYLPYVSKKNKLLKIWEEVKNEKHIKTP